MKTVFIGAGSMTEAILTGTLKAGALNNKEVWITNKRNQKRLEFLSKKFNIHSTYDLSLLLKNVQVVLLAVKPKDAYETISSIKPFLSKEVLVISVMAGISTKLLAEMIGLDLPITRAMPNTSAAVGHSTTALTFNSSMNTSLIETTHSLFQSIGFVTCIEEDQLDLVTALTGSGPAYFYYLVEQMEAAAEKLGLDKQTASLLVKETFYGAGKMLKSSPKRAVDLRKDVTSPGGTTEMGIHILETRSVDVALSQCIDAATRQAKTLRLQVQNDLSEKMNNIR
ncbi:pyrroline-5-carboxylate reductase [Bacillus sp. 2205SS5-2]|uniref:pyrroline-5-carboxylate reductase n=1 Tax=Bacillus sp. 2205SS5-2 TaxID=3109031 RepID=UPI003004DFE0